MIIVDLPYSHNTMYELPETNKYLIYFIRSISSRTSMVYSFHPINGNIVHINANKTDTTAMIKHLFT